MSHGTKHNMFIFCFLLANNVSIRLTCGKNPPCDAYLSFLRLKQCEELLYRLKSGQNFMKGQFTVTDLKLKSKALIPSKK